VRPGFFFFLIEVSSIVLEGINYYYFKTRPNQKPDGLQLQATLALKI
jgi:hypothetical protein